MHNSSSHPSEEVFLAYCDSEDHKLYDMTDSNCGSPDTRMDSLPHRVCSDSILYNI